MQIEQTCKICADKADVVTLDEEIRTEYLSDYLCEKIHICKAHRDDLGQPFSKYAAFLSHPSSSNDAFQPARI
jgi:hypothetical protein